jgi:hypothetical protein
MARHKAAFQQGDATRAMRAVHAAGLEVARVEIEKGGKIVVIPGKPEQSAPAPAADEWANI